MTSSTDLLSSSGSTSKGVEFFIDTIDRGKDGALRYIGYINSGGSVSIGDVFVQAYVIPRPIEDVRMMAVGRASEQKKGIADAYIC